MSSGDLPKDFPLKEANLLGPMIHLLLDKVEEMARMNELPPQYPNDQDKYDADVWTLAPNKPDYFKSGIKFIRQRDSIITKSSDATSLALSMEKESKKESSTALQKLTTMGIAEGGKVNVSAIESSNIPALKINEKLGTTSNAYASVEEATQTDKSSRISSLKKSSKDNEIRIDAKKERMEIPKESLKTMQHTLTATSDKSAKAKMKVYRTVPSRLRKRRKSSPARLQISRSAPSTTRRKRHSSKKNLKKRSKRIGKQKDDIPQRQKTSFRLKDYFDGIDPNNALYRSVFKLRRKEPKINASQGEKQKMKVDNIHRKSTNPIIKSVQRSDHGSKEMIDMPTEASIPCCPVHKAPPLCSNILQRFELPMGCDRKTFDYQVRAWKDNEEILLPSKVTVRRIPNEGVDMHFIVDTSALQGVKPFILRAYCPNYEAHRVWINGKLCFR